MKFKKIVCIIIMAAVTLSLLGATGSASGVEKQYDTSALPSEVTEIIKLQAQAVEAWNVLYGIFDVNGGAVTYPVDFAGGWIDGSNLHIALTEKADLNKYKELLKNYDCIVFETAKYSLNDLDGIRDIVFNAMQDDYPITGGFANEKENNIVLRFSDLDERRINSFLSEYISKELSTKFESINNNLPSESDLFSLETGEVAVRTVSLIGGMGIRHALTGNGFTLGACGKWGTVDGFVTAGHGALSRGETFYYGSSWVGTIDKVVFGNNTYDYSFVELKSGNTLTNKVYTDWPTPPTDNIIGSYMDPAVGSVLTNYGATTGHGSLTVTARNVTKSFGAGINTIGLTETTLRSGSVAPGDSGGPVTMIDYPGVQFCGVQVGVQYPILGLGPTWVFFTPYVRFSGFTVKTS